MSETTAAIGIFDSGIGGLSVAKEVARKLPDEKIIYFGDTAHLPYGEKSSYAIKEYAQGIVKFLLQKNLKTLIIACNSIASHAYHEIRAMLPEDLLLLDVIRPSIDYIIEKGYDRVGIIGTRATISSKLHARMLTHRNHEMSIYPLATPLLVPMIEEGFIHNKISEEILDAYLSHPPFAHIQALVLACTHYPLIKKEIGDYFDSEVDVIDNAYIVAQEAYDKINAKGLLASERAAENEFYVSDYTDSFADTAKMFFGEKIQIQETEIWKYD